MSTSAIQAHSSPFDELPQALLLSVLLLLPRLVDRVRCSLVSKRWAAVLREPALWCHLAFEGAREEHLSSDTLLQLVRRAAGQLQSLDVTAKACRGFSGSSGGLVFLERLAAEGALTAQLQSLCSAPDEWVTVADASDARRLAAACPALAHASVLVDCEWPDFPAVARALPLAGRTVARLHCVSADDIEQASGARFVDFAAALVDGLSRTFIDMLQFEPRTGQYEEEGFIERSFEHLFAAGDRPDTAQAASQLAAALADPQRGPRALLAGRPDDCNYGVAWGCLPAFSQLCHALTPESRLQELVTGDSWADGEVAALLAETLLPGRSRLESIRIHDGDIVGGTGCAASASTPEAAQCCGTPWSSPLCSPARPPLMQRPRFSLFDVYRARRAGALFRALGSNTSLTSLELSGETSLGGNAVATLCRALASNRTLRQLEVWLFADWRAKRIFEAIGESAPAGGASTAAAAAVATVAEGDYGRRAEGEAVLSAAVLSSSTSSGAPPGSPVSALTSLWINRTDIDAAAGAALTSSLKRGAVLQQLVIDASDGYTVDGPALARGLGEVLSSLWPVQLRDLRLPFCQMGDGGARLFMNRTRLLVACLMCLVWAGRHPSPLSLLHADVSAHPRRCACRGFCAGEGPSSSVLPAGAPGPRLEWNRRRGRCGPCISGGGSTVAAELACVLLRRNHAWCLRPALRS